MGQNASMHKHTERELERTGIAVGVTVTAEMLEKLRKMLEERDSKVDEFSENLLYRTEHLVDIARMLMRPEDELPLVDRIKPDVEALKSEVVKLRDEETQSHNLHLHLRNAAKEAGVDIEKLWDAACDRMERKLPI